MLLANVFRGHRSAQYYIIVTPSLAKHGSGGVSPRDQYVYSTLCI
jgi:hypothetical protein